MQLLHSLPAALLLAIAAFTTPAVHGFHFFSNDPVEVEHQEVAVNAFYSAVAITSLGDKRNYANKYTQPICVTEVLRVREAVVNGTRDMFVEVHGCTVDKPRGACDAATECQVVPFEVNVLGPETARGFDPVTALRLGHSVKSPYKVRSIGVLLG